MVGFWRRYYSFRNRAQGTSGMGRAEDLFEGVVSQGEAAIDNFILSRQSEELFLDFKCSADNGSRQHLDNNDRQSLADAISGFGNSEGGVIVWGIECRNVKDRGDVPCSKVKIQDPPRFVSWLESAVSGCTIPPHSGVRSHAVLMPEQAAGYVVTLIPKSDHAPHQVVGSLKYFMRAGSSFVPVPHAVLAGMFGRRPQPKVHASFLLGPPSFVQEAKLKLSTSFLIFNQGPGIANDLFMNAWIQKPGANCELFVSQPNPDYWMGQFSFSSHMSVISRNEVRLPPESQLQPFYIDLFLAPPFTKDYLVDGICGCGQAPSFKFKILASSTSVGRLYQDFLERNRKGSLNEQDHADLSRETQSWITSTS